MRATHAYLALLHAYDGVRGLLRGHLLRLSNERGLGCGQYH